MVGSYLYGTRARRATDTETNVTAGEGIAHDDVVIKTWPAVSAVICS